MTTNKNELAWAIIIGIIFFTIITAVAGNVAYGNYVNRHKPYYKVEIVLPRDVDADITHE